MSLLTKTKTNTKTKKISSISLFEMMIWYQVHSLALCGANIVDNFLQNDIYHVYIVITLPTTNEIYLYILANIRQSQFKI